MFTNLSIVSRVESIVLILLFFIYLFIMYLNTRLVNDDDISLSSVGESKCYSPTCRSGTKQLEDYVSIDGKNQENYSNDGKKNNELDGKLT